MKYLYLFGWLPLMLISCKLTKLHTTSSASVITAERLNVSGKWVFASDNGFVLELFNEPGFTEVTGKHCFVREDGMKIDCDFEGISLKAIMEGRKIIGKVKSSFEVDSLSFEINMMNDSMFIFKLKSEIGLSMFSDEMVFERE